MLEIPPSRVFDPIPGEFDMAVTEITGRLPEELTGTLYRNGAGRWAAGSVQLDCLFDPDGMVSAFVLDGRGARFRNRYVRTRHYRRVHEQGRAPGRLMGRRRPGGVLANALRRPPNTANTSVLVRGDRLLALWEAGRPHELDPDTLRTLGTTDLGGVLKGPLGAYSAHYCHDPESGSTVNFGFDPYLPRLDGRGPWTAARLRELLAELRPRPRLRLYETDRSGATRYLRSVSLPAMCFVHDMALTPRYAIFAATPLRFDPVPIVTGSASPAEAMHFARDTAALLLLVPRDGSPVRVVETDPFFVFHFGNAYEDGHDVVIDFPRFAPEDFHPTMAFFTGIRTSPGTAAPFTRHRVHSSGKVTIEHQTDLRTEFPRFDDRHATRPHTVTFGVFLRDGTLGVTRLDHATGGADSYHHPDDSLVEPVFVPRSPTAPEGDGWLLTVGYHGPSHRSRLMVFDARRLSDGPLAEAWLPFHVPVTFHGAFTSRVAA